MALVYFIIGLILGIILGTAIIFFINFEKIFLKKVKFLENEFNIPEPLIYSLYNINNKDGYLSLWWKGKYIFNIFIPPIITAILLVIIFFILWLTGSAFGFEDYIIIPFFFFSFLPGGPLVIKKIKKLLSSNKFYGNIPTNFKYSKITFEGSQKDIENARKELMKIYKQVKVYYNSFRFSLYTIKFKFNYYFVYLRMIGNLLNSKKIINFLSQNESIEIIVDNKRINLNEFKQVLLTNFFCVFYYFNFYGCSTDFLNDFEEFENSEIIKNGYKFEEINDTNVLVNDGTAFVNDGTTAIV